MELSKEHLLSLFKDPKYGLKEYFVIQKLDSGEVPEELILEDKWRDYDYGDSLYFVVQYQNQYYIIKTGGSSTTEWFIDEIVKVISEEKQ